MSDPASLDDLHWLVGNAAKPWLSIAAEAGQPTPKLIQALRKELSAERVHLVLEQARLRIRATEKFADAAQLFFTPVGLEQATDQWLAYYKAARFPTDAPIADLCCGVGGDLMALALRGPTVGVDCDPAVAILAQANLRVRSQSDTRETHSVVRCHDATEFDLNGYPAWHIDPDRRPDGRRTTRVALHEPTVDAMNRMLGRNPNAAIKLAPAADLPDDWRDRAEQEWISRRRESRQLVAWFGDLAVQPGRRVATVLGPSGDCLRQIVGAPGAVLDIAPRIGSYVFEPDAAVLAAALSGILAAEWRLTALAPRVAYLTGEQPIVDAALGCFRVLAVLPLRYKTINSWLEQREIGILEIKKRGIDLDPAKVRKQLRLSGANRGVLLITKIAGRAVVIGAERVSADADSQLP